MAVDYTMKSELGIKKSPDKIVLSSNMRRIVKVIGIWVPPANDLPSLGLGERQCPVLRHIFLHSVP